MGFMDAAQAGSRIAGKVSGNTGMKPMGMQGGQGIGPSNPMGGMNPMNPGMGRQMRTQRPSLSQPQSQMGQMPGRMGQMGGMMGGMFGGMNQMQKPPQQQMMRPPDQQMQPPPTPRDNFRGPQYFPQMGGGMGMKPLLEIPQGNDMNGGWGRGGGMRDFQMGNQQPTFADPGMFRRMNPNMGGGMGPSPNGLQDFLTRMGGMNRGSMRPMYTNPDIQY